MQCPACGKKSWIATSKIANTSVGKKWMYILECELGHWWYDAKER